MAQNNLDLALEVFEFISGFPDGISALKNSEIFHKNLYKFDSLIQKKTLTKNFKDLILELKKSENIN
jgi:hypothetical protein